ncbi:glucose-1-phosphate cytidylyltransferase [Ruegeria sp. HKCCD7318]|uniref:glucose-1-phosphate cytidylyltransferase n=1 Tax=Ruegeria sp. HKCCD7318 TaxID=2683014 RepID=UPI001491AE0E|nr:glucose-1-phosphate cytidylyltransferase [Ruegeria sp. HKCCD7318]NOE35850.1 glucose-1-phosphate cytidylyltransferase [Ruegeria sp. HKCCD7318]
MKCVILAGGLGTRLSEETVKIPKPMVEIGGKPIIWHIMKIYAANGVTDFIVCLGYKGYVIKEYFANFFLHSSDVTIDLASGSLEIANSKSEPWRVTLVDTGDNSQTGGRLKRVIPLVQDEEAFCLTYGDGVGNINVRAGIDFHQAHGKLATVTAVPPPRRFGQLEMSNNQVLNFSEKPVGDGGLINGGFFVLSPEVGKYIEGDATAWEREPLMTLTRDNELMSFEHKGFWQPMDTIRERQELEEHWATGNAPWKIWE